MDIKGMMQLKSKFERFGAEHPKFSAFLSYATSNLMVEGAKIEIKIIPAGATEDKAIETSMQLTENDIDLINTLKSVKP